jgi:hypothetical protein
MTEEAMGPTERRVRSSFPGEHVEFGLHLGIQGGELRLVAALSLFGEELEGFSLALVGLQDRDVKLELLLALVLAALEPAAEDLQEGGAPADGGDGCVNTVGDFVRVVPSWCA